MTKNLFKTLVVILMVGIFSCTEDNISQSEIRKEVKIVGTLKGVSSTTEVTTRVTGKKWDKGDLIGLYMMKSGDDLSQSLLANNVKYRTDGSGAFINNTDKKVFYPLNKQSVDFISYYPYEDTITNFEYAFNIPINQNSSQFNDFLYSNNVTNSTSDDALIKLKFTYQLAKVVVKIHDSYTKKFHKLSDDANAEVMITNVNTKGSFSLIDGVFDNSIINVENVIFKITTDGNAEALLLPIDFLDENTISIKFKDNTYTLQLGLNDENNSLLQSTQYIYTLQLDGSELIGFTAEIVDRETVNIDGITLSPDPKGEEDSGGAGEAENETPLSGDNGENDDGVGENTGSGEDSSGEGGDTGVEPNEPDDPVVVENSQENPYTITQILEMIKNENYHVENKTYKEKIWVKGYIVGSYKNNEFSNKRPDSTTGSNYNIALSDSFSSENGDNTIPVEILHSSFNALLNLGGNFGNLGKDLVLKGDLADWSSVNIHRPAIIKLQEVVFEGKSYPK